MQDDSPATRVKVPEAARILGVSVDTVRRRIRSGALKATRKKTSSGHVWMVELPAGYAPIPLPPVAGASELEALRREISELRRELRELREALQARPQVAQATGPRATAGEPVLPWLQRRTRGA